MVIFSNFEFNLGNLVVNSQAFKSVLNVLCCDALISYNARPVRCRVGSQDSAIKSVTFA